jgi:hypothetical protein
LLGFVRLAEDPISYTKFGAQDYLFTPVATVSDPPKKRKRKEKKGMVKQSMVLQNIMRYKC